MTSLSVIGVALGIGLFIGVKVASDRAITSFESEIKGINPQVNFEILDISGLDFNEEIYGDVLRIEENSFPVLKVKGLLKGKNTYDYLKPNGIFRLVMPDLFSLAQKYVKSDDPDSSIIFFKESLLGVTKRERSLGVFLRNYLGSSQHLWLWDFKSVKKELENIGFKQIQQAHFGDSQDPKFHEVEDKSRWDDCLGIECVK